VAVQDQLRIVVRHEQDRIVLGLHGELDLASVPLLESEIQSAEMNTTRMVVLDLEDLQFMDSAGLRTILSAHECSQERGQKFALTRGPQQIQRLLAITGVSEHLRIIASPDEMLV
jgi:anti-sigma B factor antagonist